MDHVDRILEQWNRERPDLDVAPMGLIGRLKRVGQHLSREMDKTFAVYGLNSASFDVLATLRRSGAPYGLSPGELLNTMMITSGTMTNRIDRLQEAGLVERVLNPDDRRSATIMLTAEGLAVIEAAVTAHVATQARLISSLSKQEREALNGLLRKCLAAFEAESADGSG